MEVFNNLDFMSKRDILKKHAVYVASLVYFQYVIKLYSWDRFFIEQYYDTEEKAITRISIAGEKELEKHLTEINLSSLI